MLASRVLDRAGWNRIRLAQRVLRWIGAEQRRVVFPDSADSRGPVGRDNQVAACRVVRVGPQFLLQPLLQSSLMLSRKLICRPAMLALRPLIQQPRRLAMEPVGRPVRGHVRAMSPHAAHFLTAHRLPHVLPIADFGAGEEDCPIRGNHAIRPRRRLAIQFAPKVTQCQQRARNHHSQQHPQSRIPHGYRASDKIDIR